jgi:hypothetical protein
LRSSVKEFFRKEEKMFCFLSRRTLRRCAVQGMGSTAAHAVLAMLLLSIPQVVSAQTAADFEKPPVLNVKDLIAANLLQGQGFHVKEEVPTDGVMGVYTLVADKETFGENAGTYQVLSREMAELRLSEIPAIIKLNETSRVGTFAKSVAVTAIQPLESAGHMVMNPVDTVTGLPSGVGRFFDRVGGGVGRLVGSEPIPGTGGEEGGAADATRDLLGYEQERRELAKKLGVDPYTTNPVLAKKLDEIATTAFRARVSVNTAISVFVPASIILTGVRTMDNLVWDTPRGDLIVQVENRLKEFNVSPTQRTLFLNNPAVPLSLQVAVVENLNRLANAKGREDVIWQMGTVATESQARFIATSVRMLAEYHEKRKPITAVAAPGAVIGRDQDGLLILPAPVDYISWTEKVAYFAQSPKLLAVPRRVLWITGGISPRAKKEFAANLWTIHEGKEP